MLHFIYMKSLLFIFLVVISSNIYSKEYKNLKKYQELFGNIQLAPSDWLCKDRKNNTLVWQQANVYNLENNLPLEYETIQQRTDFYLWLFKTLDKKEQEVVWPKMAHYISNKLEITHSFPFNIFIRKEVKRYATKGSETVFIKAFGRIKELYFSESILKSDNALTWDEAIIHEEQYIWLQEIYNEIDPKTLKTIDKMAKGKCVYKFMVPKEVVFSGDLSNEENRYNYALNTLRVYCQTEYE
ncbi:Insecticidal toxin complex protein [Xanthomarina sp. F2636L]|uniref:Insecticidal toxin complex protein n=1 Tax=Xanthomarina sp. F2636L TaxID=2996018 RepID=UPI00225E2971|nr:Insecticidal toxin complex protein [Xanthomarina sp. F2636L]MCX7550231.1 Insecticidal toxin complex protein [Xanthomarina sp. F2636L]